MSARNLQTLTDWLIDGARSASSPAAMMAATCEHLVEAGLPLWRVSVFVRTLHPDVFGVRFTWRPDTEVEVNAANFDVRDSEQFRSSPLAILYQREAEVRYRLDDPESRRFPFLDEMRTEDVTDYIALPLHFTDGSIHVVSFTTRHPEGFTDEQLEALRTFAIPFSRLSEIWTWRRTAATLTASGIRAVRLSYDDSLFSGPAVNPAWEASYLPDDVVTPVSALWVDEGLGPGGTTPRASEPAAEAAATSDKEAELLADLQRVTAEYANYRKRVDRDRQLVAENAAFKALTPIVEVLDTIDRAREHGELDGGFKAVADQLERAVATSGLVRFGEQPD